MSEAVHTWRDDSFHQITLLQMFEQHVKTHPDAPFITFYGQTFSYARIHKEMKALLKYWQSQNIQRGGRIALCLPNSPQWVTNLLQKI
ncbi:MAG: AMP-binding protein [Bacilli bacterium]